MPDALWLGTVCNKQARAITALFVMNSISENNFENAIEYLLKGKIYNNSGFGMLLLLMAGKVTNCRGRNH